MTSVETSPLARPLLLFIIALASACGSTPSPPGRLENVGGSYGGEADASVSPGTGGGGSGGAEPLDTGAPDADDDAGTSDTDALDAGSDARAPASDAAPAVEGGCVQGGDDSSGPGPGNGNGPGNGPGNGNDPPGGCVYSDN